MPVRNGGPALINCIDSWLSQKLPDEWSCSFTLVDDGSTDAIPQKIADTHANAIRLVRHECTKGRAVARNAGADAGTGEYILFVDADCHPASEDTLSNLIRQFTPEADLIFGRLDAKGTDFWSIYFREVSARRESRFVNGEKTALTTASCAMKRTAFYRIGKFSCKYTHYGFEDRDFFARAANIGLTMRFAKNSIFLHHDKLGLDSVCKKMWLSGRYSSSIFMKEHPFVYRKMAFHHTDVRCGPTYLKIRISRILKPQLINILKIGELCLSASVPYKFKSIAVKTCSALYYLVGTYEAFIENKAD